MRNTKQSVATGLVVVALLSFGLTYLVKPGDSHAASICSVSAKLVNSCRPWIGGFASGYGQAAIDEQSQILYQEQRQGRQDDIVHTYHSLGSNTLSSIDTYFANRANTILFTNWKPSSKWSTITSANAAIDSMANSIKALGSTKIMLTLWHEPENDVSPGGDPSCPNVNYKGSAGSVADYRNMWAYTENRFAADGVNNVVWVMDYMSFANWDCLVPDLYPGDNLIDWVTWDPYGPDTANTPSDFVGTVSRFANLLTADSSGNHNFVSKPWGFGEWGIGGNSLTYENQWYDQAKAALDNNTFPNIKMYNIFDAPTSNGWNGRVGYDDNGTVDPAKGAHYYNFVNDSNASGSWVYQSTTPPGSPSNLTANTNGSGQVTLNWSPGSVTQAAIAGYNVYRSDNSLSPIATVTNGTTYVDTPPANGTSYSYSVATLDVTGNTSTPAISPSIVTADTTPPSAPTNLAATIAGASEIDLTWTPAVDNVGVTGYNIYRNGTLLTTVGAVSSYNDLSVDTTGTNSYTVSAFDAAHNTGPASASVTAVPADTTPPTIPQNLDAALSAPYQISLNWQSSTDNVGVIGYAVFRDGTQIATVTDGSNVYIDSGLNDNTTYSYTVSAYDAAGNSSPQTPITSLLLPDETAPSVPGSLKATVSGSTANLSWQAATDNVGVAGYNIYRNGVQLTTLPGTATSYTDTGLKANASYTYTVTAYDAQANTSSQSNSATVIGADVTPPSIPTGLSITATTVKSVSLSWAASTDDTGVTGYTIYRNGTQLTKVGNVIGYTDGTAAPSTSYTYKILAFDAAGNASSQSGGVTTTTPADTTAPSAPTNLTLTPTSTTITVKWGASTDNYKVASYTIYRNNVKLGTSTSLSYTDSTVKQGSTYSYYAVALDPAGHTSAHSNTASLLFPDTTPPTVPKNTTATTGTTSKTVVVKWGASTDNVGVTGYRVYKNSTLVTTTSGSTLSYTVTGLASGTSYSFHVVAIDAAGNASAASSSISAKAR